MQVQDCRDAVTLCLGSGVNSCHTKITIFRSDIIVDLDHIVAHSAIHRSQAGNGIDQHQIFIAQIG